MYVLPTMQTNGEVGGNKLEKEKWVRERKVGSGSKIVIVSNSSAD